MREFAPVTEPVEFPPSLRQTLLSQFDKCPRSGYLSLRYGGGASTDAQARGTVFHEMAERAVREMVEAGEETYDPTLARDLVEQVLQERPDLIVPTREHESLRSMAWNWGRATHIPLETLIGVERTAYIEVAGPSGKVYRLHGTLDLTFRVQGNGGWIGGIRDYKTGFVIPKQEEFERQFQGIFYALLLAEGRWEDTDEPILPGDVVGVQVAQLYPRHFNETTGRLDQREAFFEPGDIAAFKQSVVTVLSRIERGIETGQYPAQAGHHCGLCPAPHECPIPQEFRRGSVQTLEEAGEALSLAEALTGEATRLKGDARTFAEENDHETVPLGEDSDLEYAFTVVRSEVIADKVALKAAIAEKGNTEEFFTERTSTKFAKRKRK